MAPGLVLRESEELTLSTRGYRLLQKLGEGSYAQVFLAEFVNQGKSTQSTKSTDNSDKPSRVLACKIVDVSKAPPDFVKKFLPRELDILVRISHPHIIHIHSIFQRKTKYFIFMRHAENGDLLEYVLKKGPIPEVQSRVWFRQLTLAVQYLHDMDIAHRDLKCENCLITNNYNLKLADFGFARFVTDAHGRRLTSTTYCGSLSYAAPEVLKGMPYYPKNADIWSMGIILYIMINKAMPFDDANVKRLNEQQLNRRWKFRQKVVDQLSDQVKNLVASLLEPDITKRLRLNDILSSDWLAMDPRLKVLSQLEESALAQAQVDRKKYIDQLNKKAGRDKKSDRSEEMKILKSTDGEELAKPDDPSSAALPT
ncbi:testis-specific serine/threonine-protein kinase 1-like [Diabrotica virgifera virgifera]|uniref:Testis-specific serine/threonine-protein kinase 1-like n=1 Tax=Diabrotica virgifera virgifera TaxID=50390 RepID=A0A6P7FAZ5_DIAVI|nr:testis-specific serine/threonine-protein kinase 1-like [Diabrotica virgifera virgifera]